MLNLSLENLFDWWNNYNFYHGIYIADKKSVYQYLINWDCDIDNFDLCSNNPFEEHREIDYHRKVFKERIQQIIQEEYKEDGKNIEKHLTEQDCFEAKVLITQIENLRNSSTNEKKSHYNILKPIYLKCKEFEIDAMVGRYMEVYQFSKYYTNVADAIELWEQEVEPFMRIYDHTEESEENPSRKELPTKGTDSIITERAKKYFQRAIEAGYMKETETGYKWGQGIKGDKTKLGYFLKRIYNPRRFSEIPYQALEKLFEEKRLDSTINKMNEWKNTPKWVDEIEETIFYD